MAICTHWEGKGKSENRREEENNKNKERRFSLLEAQKPFHKQSKLRTQRIISLSRVGWLLSSAVKYFIYHAIVKLANVNFTFHNHSDSRSKKKLRKVVIIFNKQYKQVKLWLTNVLKKG